jgi:hypothetical protein
MTRSTAFPAKYFGTCPACGGPWRQGDMIRRHGTTDPPASRPIWGHDICPESEDPTELKAGEEVCTKCWLVHPKGACDRE